MEALLAAAFPDADFTLNNDSAQHHGHAGDDGSGEPHFSLTIRWAGFAGQTGNLSRWRFTRATTSWISR